MFAAPRHPYTDALIGCIPRDGMAPGSLRGIPGTVAAVSQHGAECCRFAPRCGRADALCTSQCPALVAAGQGGLLACHHPMDIPLPEAAHVGTF